MPKTEQRAFAAVRPGQRGPIIMLDTVRSQAGAARTAGSRHWAGDWPEAKRRGWRIRPVLIRVEDETQETAHD